MLERLLGIIYILMNKKSVTAKELAERFEVSVRTIYRDIDALGISGIPVYTQKGKNGGISLTEQFVLDKRLVNRKEQEQILAALVSLEETGALRDQETVRKMKEFFNMEPQKWVEIDFSDWSGYKQEMFEQLKEAILSRRLIEFDYYGQSGEMNGRTAEPLQLLFKDHIWYLKAFCRGRQAMRLFKTTRMKRIKVLDDEFSPENIKPEASGKETQDFMYEASSFEHIVLKINASEAYRIYDRFEEDEIEVMEDGSFLTHIYMPVDDWVYGLILSFGASAVVLKPERIRNEVKSRIQNMLNQYE